MRMNHDFVTVNDAPGRRPPPRVDRSLVDLLLWCGLDEGRALDIVADADRPEGRMLLHETLGQDINTGTVMNDLSFSVRLGSASWNGRRLKVRVGEMPETLLEAMPGRRLVDVVDHGALPRRRTITRARVEDQFLTLDTDGDAVRRDDRLLADAAQATRSLVRRRARHLRAAASEEWSMATAHAGIVMMVVFGLQMILAMTLMPSERLGPAVLTLATMLGVSLAFGVAALYLCVTASAKNLRLDHERRMDDARARMRTRWEGMETAFSG